MNCFKVCGGMEQKLINLVYTEDSDWSQPNIEAIMIPCST